MGYFEKRILLRIERHDWVFSSAGVHERQERGVRLHGYSGWNVHVNDHSVGDTLLGRSAVRRIAGLVPSAAIGPLTNSQETTGLVFGTKMGLRLLRQRSIRAAVDNRAVVNSARTEG